MRSPDSVAIKVNLLINNPQTATSRGKILIVDDTPFNLKLLSAILKPEGYHVRQANSGEAALRVVQIEKPDLILLDINMPEIDGYEVCKQFKTIPQVRDVPVIFISALDDVLNQVKAFEVGGVDYLTKPFRLQEVLASVENQLNQYLAEYC